MTESQIAWIKQELAELYELDPQDVVKAQQAKGKDSLAAYAYLSGVLTHKLQTALKHAQRLLEEVEGFHEEPSEIRPFW